MDIVSLYHDLLVRDGTDDVVTTITVTDIMIEPIGRAYPFVFLSYHDFVMQWVFSAIVHTFGPVLVNTRSGADRVTLADRIERKLYVYADRYPLLIDDIVDLCFDIADAVSTRFAELTIKNLLSVGLFNNEITVKWKPKRAPLYW